MKQLFFIILIFLTYVPTVRANSIRDELRTTAKRVEQRESKARAKRVYLARVQKVRGYLDSKGSPLAVHAESFIRCGDAVGIIPSLIVGITKAESSFGLHYQLANNPFNWGVHNGITFKTMEDGICTVAQGLKRNYDLSNTYTIGKRFAPASDGNNPNHWAQVVQGVINEIGI